MSAELALRTQALFPALAELAAAWSPVFLGAAVRGSPSWRISTFQAVSGMCCSSLHLPAPRPLCPQGVAGCLGRVEATVNSEVSSGVQRTYLALPSSFCITHNTGSCDGPEVVWKMLQRIVFPDAFVLCEPQRGWGARAVMALGDLHVG